MSDLYKNKYRISPARAQWWDYGNSAAYFVTICTQHKEHFFGQIAEKQFIASPLGEIALTCWLQIPNHFPYVHLDAFVVMPNHVHGIIIIDKPDGPVETRFIASLRGGFANDKNPVLNDNLARVVRWYKGRTSFEGRRNYADFAWQPRYHDHIIRQAASHEKIRDYILNNPGRWQTDKFYSI